QEGDNTEAKPNQTGNQKELFHPGNDSEENLSRKHHQHSGGAKERADKKAGLASGSSGSSDDDSESSAEDVKQSAKDAAGKA
ncbi:hypothetical protein NQU49_27675, partial [Escherichia coli]|nr:hypothetical protein [Escherichia coli]